MSAKGKHSPPGAGNIYAKANEVIVKITGADTGQTFEIVDENCKAGFQSRAHYHTKAYETFYVFDGAAEFKVGDEVFHGTKGSCVHIPPGVEVGYDHEHDRARGFTVSESGVVVIAKAYGAEHFLEVEPANI